MAALAAVARGSNVNPKKIFKNSKPRSSGYLDPSNPVFPYVKKLVFIGCGTSSAPVVSAMTYARPSSFEIIVYEPKQRRKLFFPGNLYDLFTKDEPRLNVEVKLTDAIFPKGYQDNTWDPGYIVHIDPEKRLLIDNEGRKDYYDFLCIGSGAHSYWDEITNLKESVSTNGIHSLYTNNTEHFEKFREEIQNFKGGKVLFYSPAGEVTHPGTNISLVNLCYDHFKDKDIQDFSIHHYSPNFYTLGDPFVDSQIRASWAQKGVHVEETMKLIEVRPETKEAVFQNVANNQTVVEKFDILHVIPPMAAIPAVRNSKILSTKDGWLNVCPKTMTHDQYPNIFGWGSGARMGVPKSFYSSAIQSSHGWNTVFSAFRALQDRPNLNLQYQFHRGIYDMTGVEAVHLDKNFSALVSFKETHPYRHQHFPYVWKTTTPLAEQVKIFDQYWETLTTKTLPLDYKSILSTIAIENLPCAEDSILEEWCEI